jgi:tetratricopeptide (TPR) repeat protein
MARFDRLEMGGSAEEPIAPPMLEKDGLRDAGSTRSRIADSPEESDCLRQADLERRRGHYENALRQFSRALELEKSLVAGWVGQVQMLVLLDEAPEANLWAMKAIELFPGNGELLAARAQAACRVGDMKQAHALIDGAMAATGKSAYRWQVRGEVMLANRQTVEEHCFSKARQQDSDWLIPMETALIYLRYKIPSKAAAHARLATESNPDQSYAWYVRGIADMALDHLELARKSFERCLQLSPNHSDAKSRVAQLASERWSFGRLVRALLPKR